MLNTDLQDLENQYPNEIPPVNSKVGTRHGSELMNQQETKEPDLSGEMEVVQREVSPHEVSV